MIFKDHNGFPVNETGDHMDSCFRAGILTTFGQVTDIASYYRGNGMLCRSPYIQSLDRSSNPWNMTRDNTIPWMSAAHSLGPRSGARHDAREVYLAHLKRFCFAQNVERDEFGSTKAPWPHRFVNDEGTVEQRRLDGPDFCFPHVMLFYAFAARHWSWPLWLPIGLPMMLLSIIFNSKKIDAEQNQIQCMVKTLRLAWFYKMTNPNYEEQTDYYWKKRNEIEYSFLILNEL